MATAAMGAFTFTAAARGSACSKQQTVLNVHIRYVNRCERDGSRSLRGKGHDKLGIWQLDRRLTANIRAYLQDPRLANNSYVSSARQHRVRPVKFTTILRQFLSVRLRALALYK